jgi:hypothetical protein
VFFKLHDKIFISGYTRFKRFLWLSDPENVHVITILHRVMHPDQRNALLAFDPLGRW